MNKLIDITNKLFEEHVKEGEKSYTKNNMKATYKSTETRIVAGDKNEFVGQVYFEIDIDVKGEKDYTSTERIMRIKKMKNDKGILHVKLRDNDKIINFMSNDKGKT